MREFIKFEFPQNIQSIHHLHCLSLIQQANQTNQQLGMQLLIFTINLNIIQQLNLIFDICLHIVHFAKQTQPTNNYLTAFTCQYLLYFRVNHKCQRWEETVSNKQRLSCCTIFLYNKQYGWVVVNIWINFNFPYKSLLVTSES